MLAITPTYSISLPCKWCDKRGYVAPVGGLSFRGQVHNTCTIRECFASSMTYLECNIGNYGLRPDDQCTTECREGQEELPAKLQ